MKIMQKTLSAILSLIMTFLAAPSISAEGSGEEKPATTELFCGNATYLVQQRFEGINSIDTEEGHASKNTNLLISGWDVDTEGGKVTKSDGGITFTDVKSTERVSMNHKLMAHYGDGLVFESAFSYKDLQSDGFYYTVSGGGKTAFNLLIKDGNICVKNPGGTLQNIGICEKDVTYGIKAEFESTKKKVKLYLNGIYKGEFDYFENTDQIDEIEIGTDRENVGKFEICYVYAYINYAVNETFMSMPKGSVPAWWSATNGTVCAAPGAPYKADLNGFAVLQNGNLYRNFDPISGKVSLIWDMLIPENGIGNVTVSAKDSAGNMPLKFSIDSTGKFLINNTDTKFSHLNNVWYKIEIKADTESDTLDLYINDVLRASDVKFLTKTGDLASIKFENADAKKTLILDNIFVHKTFLASDYADYPSRPETVKSDKYNLGMIFYPMWREGIHYGWDLITPYEERTPYLGYYTGGSREVSDWESKWLLEHGIDHAVFPFVRPDADGAVGFSVRGEELHDGFLNSEYKDMLDFAIMITNPTEDKYESGAEFIKNVEPYIVERYLKNPSYKSINNRLIVYCYNFKGIAECLGDNVSGNEFSQINMVLTSLDAAAKNIDNKNGGKYDGITFIADVSAGGIENVDRYKSAYAFGEHVLKWRYTWNTDKPDTVISGTKSLYATGSDYVASIPMGFDRTPWVKANAGMMTPDQISYICENVKEYRGDDDPNIAVFTCWDEWGEGHFYSPSEYNGFGYLNAIRKSFTKSGEMQGEELPTRDALLRMDVLYPENRQILKIKPDKRVYTAEDLENANVKGEMSLANVMGSPSGASRSYKTVSGKGFYTYTVTSPDQATFTFDFSSLNLDISDISAVKVRGYAENSANFVAYMQTNLTAGTSSPYPTSLRFEASCDGTKNFKDMVLLPDQPASLKGTLTKIRFNPAAKTATGSEMAIDTVTFYSGNLEIKVYVNSSEYTVVSKPEIKDGTVFVPAYRILLDMNAYPLWDKETKSLTVRKDGKTAVFSAGSNKVTVNGENKAISNAPYYLEGNLFVPYDALLQPFGYKAEYDAEARRIDYFGGYRESPNCWEFNDDGNTEGWTFSGVTNPQLVLGGMLKLEATTTDPIMNKTNLSIKKSDAKYAILRIKKTDKSESGMIRLYDDTTNASGVVYRYNLKASDEVQEIVFDLTKDALINATYKNTYEGLGDTITRIRIDPMDNTGTIYIDSVRIVKKLTADDFKITAYGFEQENMIQLDTAKTGFSYNNLMNKNGNTTSDILPKTETVDGYANVMKLIPISGKTEGMFQVYKTYYQGQKQLVDTVVNDNRIVKISFWYKGIGNVSAIRFENRYASSRDGEEFEIKDISSSEWKYFEGYLDLSNETTGAAGKGSRWFTLRVTTKGSTAKDGVYIRDYKAVCLNEQSPITALSDDAVAISVTPLTDEGILEKDNCRLCIAEFDNFRVMSGIRTLKFPEQIKVLNNGSYHDETAKYSYFTPSEDAKELKFMVLNGITPKCHVLSLTK